MSKASRRARRQARLEAELKYGSQSSALQSVLGGLQGDLKQSVAQARAGSGMRAAAARNALPGLRKSYGQAMSGNDAASRLVQAEVAKLPEGSPLRAAVQVGQAGAKSRLAEALGRGTDELVGRRVDARVGGAQEVRSLQGQYRADRAKTLEQLLGTAKEAGTYAASRYGQIRSDQADRGVKIRSQRETERANRADEAAADRRNDIAQQRADDANKPKPVKWATPQQQGAAQDNIASAQRVAADLKAKGYSRSEAAAIMLRGRAAETIKDPKTGVELKRPAVPKMGQLWASAGLDLAFDDHISARNQKELKRRRIRPGKLGFSLKAPAKVSPLTDSRTDAAQG